MVHEKRLIDANALKEYLNSIEASGGHAYYRKGMDDTLHFHMPNIIDDAPTVDAVEVVHAKWKYYHKQKIAVCTKCSFERNLDADFGKAVSCPNCGAKMDGDGNDL